MVIELSLAFIGLILSMFFSYSELALISANKLQINVWEKQKIRFSNFAQSIVEGKEEFMALILIGNNLSNILVTTYGTILLVKIGMVNHNLIIVLVAIVILVLCEIIPKTIVRQFSNKSLLIVSPLLLTFRFILFPLLILFKKFQIKSHKSDKEIEREKSVELREDIKHFYEHADDSVEMEKEQQEMLSTVFEFNDKNASEVMTPRTELSCISSTDNLEKALHSFIDSGHSKLPVYESDPDNIIGVIYLYDLYKNPNSLKEVIKPILQIPFSKNISDVMSIFKNKKHNMAIVLDEHGGTAGIITAEDIFEEVLGDFEDEFDHNQQEIKIETDGSVIVEAKTECSLINEKFGNKIPEGDYETISGYIISNINRIPHTGERFFLPIGQVVIKSASSRKIEKIQIFLNS